VAGPGGAENRRRRAGTFSSTDVAKFGGRAIHPGPGTPRGPGTGQPGVVELRARTASEPTVIVIRNAWTTPIVSLRKMAPASAAPTGSPCSSTEDTDRST